MVAMLVITLDEWMDGWMLAHRDVEVTPEKLDNRSSPIVALMGIEGGAARVRVQNWNRTECQSPPK